MEGSKKKSLIKIMITCFVLSFMTCGMKVRAQEMTAENRVMHSDEKFNQERVVVVYLVNDETKESAVIVAMDRNQKKAYVNFGFKSWIVDDIQYLYNDKYKQYLFAPTDFDFESENAKDEVNVDDKDNEYTYLEDVVYSGKTCYQIEQKNKRTEKIVIAYIDKETNLPLYYKGDISFQFSYPETIPEELVLSESVRNSASLASFTKIKKDGVCYISEYIKSKNETVLHVVKSDKVYKKKTLKIPDYVTAYNKKMKVVSIEGNAFYKNKKITKVVLGDHITVVHPRAFANCKNLNTVIIGDRVRKIEKEAFYKSKKLKKVTLKSKKMTKIGKKAFYGNSKKLKLEVPRKKYKKYKKLLKKSKSSSHIKMSKK